MAGLSLSTGFGGVSYGAQPSYGTQASYNSVTQAAFGPGATVEAPGTAQLLHPSTPIGLATYVGVAAVVLLVCVRRSLPN